MRMRGLITCAISLLMAGAANAALPKPYDVLSRKSIFARDRVSRMPSTSRTPRPVDTRSTVPVLIGILLQDDGCAAVLESASGGTVTELRPGQPLPGSNTTVADISLDYIELAIPGAAELRRVYIGQNIEGTETALSTTGPTTGPSTLVPIEGEDLISRMRRRRQQEMSK